MLNYWRRVCFVFFIPLFVDSPQRAHLLYCSGLRSVTHPLADRCTTVARWDSWHCRSHWCPAGRGRCPGSRRPNGPNTPPPPHTVDGKREGERGKGRINQTSRLKQNSQDDLFFWDATEQHAVLCKTWPLRTGVLLTAGKILGWDANKSACVTCVCCLVLLCEHREMMFSV